MIGVLPLLGALSASTINVTLVCRIWESGGLAQMTPQTQFEPQDPTPAMYGGGNVQISFERVENGIRNPRILVISDPMNLDKAKDIRWRAELQDSGRIRIATERQAEDNFRWIDLDPVSDGKYLARWSFNERAGPGVIWDGSGFGECSPQKFGATQ